MNEIKTKKSLLFSAYEKVTSIKNYFKSTNEDPSASETTENDLEKQRKEISTRIRKDVFIVAAKRTPLGSFQGSLSSLTAPELGSIAIRACLDSINLSGSEVDEVLIGNVLQASVGQAPARQASLQAGVTKSAPCTTINKVCASGTKALIFGAQSIMLGDNDVVITGGMESMSNVPYYLSRGNTPYGGMHLVDGVIRDGLTDAYDNIHMGLCAEKLAQTYGISREDSDAFAKQSYHKAAKAKEMGLHDKEIVSVVIPGGKRKSDITVVEDEEIAKVNFDKMPYLNPVFQKDGTITAANASSLNDGAAACILMSEVALNKYQITPLAKVLDFADAATEPKDFGIAPAYAIEKLLSKTNVCKSQISMWELNEAFSTIGLANIKKLSLDPSKVNPFGGAVSMGHPLGCSGARIVNVLAHHLRPEELGVAAICNGGGGASAVLVQKL